VGLLDLAGDALDLLAADAPLAGIGQALAAQFENHAVVT
jgi:hypothetical protein